MEAGPTGLGIDVGIDMRLDRRAGSEPHQPHAFQRALEMRQRPGQRGGAREIEGVGEVALEPELADHSGGMGLADRGAERDRAPLARIIVADEMAGPVRRAKAGEIGGEGRRIEGEGEPDAVGQHDDEARRAFRGRE